MRTVNAIQKCHPVCKAEVSPRAPAVAKPDRASAPKFVDASGRTKSYDEDNLSFWDSTKPTWLALTGKTQEEPQSGLAALHQRQAFARLNTAEGRRKAQQAEINHWINFTKMIGFNSP